MARYFQNHPSLVTGLKLLVVAAFALAVTIPFAGQAFSHDGPTMLDFASAQLEQPLKQHIDNYDYFGVRFDRFTDTHPRFLSLYLSLVIRAAGGISEIPIHLALSVFPVIGCIGMFFLGRRFGVSGVAAALLLLVSPIFVISSHVETVDVPGTSLWLASLATFIYGVDRNDIRLLALAGILFLLTIFTFYQGLTVLGLALAYVFIKKRLSVRTLAPVLAPALLFGGYLYWFFSIYGHMPLFVYRYTAWIDPLFDRNVANHLRAEVVILGGTVLFPLVTFAGFLKHWRAFLVGVIVASLLGPWLLTRYQIGQFSGIESLMLGAFGVTGAIVLYFALESVITGAIAWVKGRNNDLLLLCLWLFGVFAYCVFFLSYPAPRYFLPAVPAVILIMLKLWQHTLTRWPAVKAALALLAIGLTIGYSAVLSLSFMEYANEARETARWARETYGNRDGQVWLDGDLGFAFYMRQNGFKMLPSVRGAKAAETSGPWPPENAQPGDFIIASRAGGGWLTTPDVLLRMRLVETRTIRTGKPVVVISPSFPQSYWTASFLLPFVITDEPVLLDEITVWQVVEEPAPSLLPELQEEVDQYL